MPLLHHTYKINYFSKQCHFWSSLAKFYSVKCHHDLVSQPTYTSHSCVPAAPSFAPPPPACFFRLRLFLMRWWRERAMVEVGMWWWWRRWASLPHHHQRNALTHGTAGGGGVFTPGQRHLMVQMRRVCPFVLLSGPPATAEAALWGKSRQGQRSSSQSGRKSDGLCCGHFTSVCFIFIMLCPLDYALRPQQ